MLHPDPCSLLDEVVDGSRFLELAKDQDGQHGRATEQSMCEARLSLTLEGRGVLFARVSRPKWGDVTDGTDQIWDFKSPHSRLAIVSRIRDRARATGQVVPDLEGVPLPGVFDAQLEADRVHAQQRVDKGVIFDLRRLTVAEARELSRVLSEDSRLDLDRILFFPLVEDLGAFE